MLHLLSEAGRSFLRAFAGSLVALAPGILAAPDLNQAKLLAVAALVSSIAAGLKALQVFVPQLTTVGVLPGRLKQYGYIVDSFLRAFVAGVLTFWIGIFVAPDFHFTKAVLIGLVIGAITAGFRAVQGLLTKGDVPAPPKGLNVPPRTP